MYDSLPAWFWIPVAVLLWAAVLIPVVTTAVHVLRSPRND